MISIAFKSDYVKSNIDKLSIIEETDSFVYGLWENLLLVESGRFPKSDYHNFIEEYKEINVYAASKAMQFTHVEGAGLDEVKKYTTQQDTLSYSPEVYTCYNTEYLNGEPTIRHFSTLIHTFYNNESGPTCFLHFGKNKMVVCITGQPGFKFYNEYEIETDVDALYYIKAVLRNTDTDESNLKTIVSGYIEEGSEIYKTLYRYSKNIEKASALNFTARNSEINPHSYFDHYLNVNR